MIQDQIEERHVLSGGDERLRAKMISHAYRPFIEGETLYFLEREGSQSRLCGVPVIRYETMHLPHQTSRTIAAHVVYLTRLVDLSPRLQDIADLLQVRKYQAFALLERYDINITRYRQRMSNTLPEHVDIEAFRHDFEVEAFSIRELEEKHAISSYHAQKIIDLKDMIEPTDAVKMIKRHARYPDRENFRTKGIPRPPVAEIRRKIREGEDTIKKLAMHYKTSVNTMREWLKDYHIKTPRMQKYRMQSDPSTGLHDAIYDLMIRKGKTLDEAVKTLKEPRTSIYRIVSQMPEWEDVKNKSRRKVVDERLLREVYLAVSEKRMTKKRACQKLVVSYNTLVELFSRLESEREETMSHAT